MTTSQSDDRGQAIWRVVGDPLLSGGSDGVLAGEAVAVKDLFAVQGHARGAGVPQYLQRAPIETQHADAVQRLIDAGAAIRGIAHTDQFAYSLAGANPHYGTPPNGAVPDALPGGSSSGSASAVATGQASIGLATDTAGSVRIPSSYQGLWGLRTTHGSVPHDGLIPLAPHFDTIGLITANPNVLLRAATVLLSTSGSDNTKPVKTNLPWAVADVSKYAPPAVCDAVSQWAATHAPTRVTAVQLPDLAQIAEVIRIHQGFQAWQSHGQFIIDNPEAVTGPVAQRFRDASHITSTQNTEALAALEEHRRRLDAVLGNHIVILPTAPSAAPRLDAPASTIQQHRKDVLRLTAVAGATGRPALTAPVLQLSGGPVGVCLIGPRGTDLTLVDVTNLINRRVG